VLFFVTSSYLFWYITYLPYEFRVDVLARFSTGVDAKSSRSAALAQFDLDSSFILHADTFYPDLYALQPVQQPDDRYIKSHVLPRPLRSAACPAAWWPLHQVSRSTPTSTLCSLSSSLMTATSSLTFYPDLYALQPVQQHDDRYIKSQPDRRLAVLPLDGTVDYNDTASFRVYEYLTSSEWFRSASCIGRITRTARPSVCLSVRHGLKKV